MTSEVLARRAGGQIVATANGPLRHLLLYFPREAAVRRGYRSVYRDLFTTLPATTRLTVLVHPKVADVLDDLVLRAGRVATTTVVPSNEDLRFTVWAQDPFLVLRDETGLLTLLIPNGFDREDDADTCDALAAAIGARVQRSPVAFHGGDVLTGDDFVLMGQTSRDLARDGLDHGRRVVVVDSGPPLSDDRTRTIHLSGRDVIEVFPGGGQSPHPLLHLDMFVTLAGRGRSGRYRILVGSPRLADDILGRHTVDEELAGNLDDVATQLAAEGFNVLRTPLPLTYGDGRREIDGALRDVRLWYLATANNCLVQVDADDGDQVWLPTYGHGAWRELAATDAANRRVWEGLGFTAHELPSFHTFAQRFGALHCIAKELDRRPGPVRGRTREGRARSVRPI